MASRNHPMEEARCLTSLLVCIHTVFVETLHDWTAMPDNLYGGTFRVKIVAKHLAISTRDATGLRGQKIYFYYF
jgi:hypothetical protein